MLVLTRKASQQIKIGDGVVVTILSVQGNSVKIGIEAPREIRVLRGELTSSNVERSSEAVAAPSEASPASAAAPRTASLVSRDLRNTVDLRGPLGFRVAAAPVGRTFQIANPK